MRTFGLLSAAAEAEALRLRRQAGALTRSVVFAAISAVFGIAALVLLHMAAWSYIEAWHGAPTASLVIALVDLVVMGILLLLGRRRHDPIAAAAAMVRDQSLAAAARAPLGFASSAVTNGLIRLITRR